MSAWPTLLIALSSILFSAAVNLFLIARYVGKYETRIEDLQKDIVDHGKKVSDLNTELVRLGKQFAAFTGIANGKSYREES